MPKVQRYVSLYIATMPTTWDTRSTRALSCQCMQKTLTPHTMHAVAHASSHLTKAQIHVRYSHTYTPIKHALPNSTKPVELIMALMPKRLQIKSHSLTLCNDRLVLFTLFKGILMSNFAKLTFLLAEKN